MDRTQPQLREQRSTPVDPASAYEAGLRRLERCRRPSDFLDAIADIARRGIPFDAAAILHPDREGTWRVWHSRDRLLRDLALPSGGLLARVQQGDVITVPDVEEALAWEMSRALPGVRTAIHIPLRDQGRPRVLVLVSGTLGAFDRAAVRYARVVTALGGQALRMARMAATPPAPAVRRGSPLPELRVGPDGVLLHANAAAAPLLELWGVGRGQALPVAPGWLRDGSRFHVDIPSLQVVFAIVVCADKDGCTLIGFDVTEGEVARAQLAHANVRFASLLRHLDAAVLLEGENGEVLVANQRFCDLFARGRTPAQLDPDARRLLDAVADRLEAPQRFLVDVDHCLEEGKPVSGAQLRCSNGAVLERDYVPIWMEGACSGHLWVFRDVTPQHQALEALRQSEARLAGLLTATDDPMWSVDCDQRLLAFNDNFGALVKEVLGRAPVPGDGLELLGDHPARRRIRTLFQRVLDGERIRLDWSLPTRPDISYEVHLAPIQECGYVVGIAAHAHDVSHRKAAARLVEQARQAAEQASEAKSTFLAHISHEIRTPLNAVLGMTEMALETARDTRVRGGLLNAVRGNAEALLHLVGDTLDFSRIEAGGFDLDEAPFSPAQLLGQVVGSFSLAATEKGLRLRTHLDPALPEQVRGDAQRFRQVATNLVGNAVKYTRLGGVTVRLQAQHEQLVLEVTDTGPGIARGDCERIFDGFYRTTDAREGGERGSGLGLTITRAIVEAMAGEISVDSTLGRGSTFRVSMPLSVADEAPTPTLEGHRILLGCADDELRERIAAQLSASGATVLAHDEGRAIISALLGGEPPTALLVDIDLPGPSPDAMVRLAREMHHTDDIRLVGLVEVCAMGASGLEVFDAVVPLPATRRSLEGALAGPQRPTPTNEGTLRRSARILVVEDTRDSAVVLSATLKGAGHQVDVATTGEQGVSMAKSGGYELVFMDIDLPGISGIDATRAIRGLPGAANEVPIVALTAHSTPDARADAADAGMQGFLSKLASRTTVLRAVADHVRLTPFLWVVDDDPDSRRLLKHYLGKAGAEFAEFACGTDVIEALSGRRPDLVLLDFELPDLRGPDVARALRASGVSAPILALSAHTHAEPREEALAAGCDAWLEKPIGMTDLVEVLGEHLGSPEDDEVDEEDDIADLRPLFVADRRRDLQTLPQLLERGAYDEVRRLGHSMKGSSAPYGFPKLGQIGAELEVAAAAADDQAARQCIERMRAFLAEV